MKLAIRQDEAWANRLRIETLEERFVENSLKNQLENEEWFIQNDSKDFCYVVKWNNYGVPHRWLNYIKSMLLSVCGGYTDHFGNIVKNTSSLKTFLGDAKRFFIRYEEKFEGRNLSDLKIENLKYLLQSLAIDSDGQLKARLTCEGYTKLINRIQESYSLGNLGDGFSFDIPEKGTDYFFKDLVESKGVEFSQWREGGTYGGMAVSIAMLLLARCIEIMRCKETQIALKLFEFARNEQIDISVLFRTHYSGKSNGGGTYLSNLAASNSKYANAAQQLIHFINSISDDKHTDWFFGSKHVFTQHVLKVYDYGTIAICMLSGYRISELRYLLGSHIYRDKDSGDWLVRSEIIKTHKGIGTIRSICDEGAEFIDILIRLSESDKIKENQPIFEFNNRRTSRHEGSASVPYNTMLRRIKDGYADFLDSTGNDFSSVCEDASPHVFRHVWVDMALRCHVPEAGYNNVTEEIRHHLRHRYGSTWTRRYMDGKFTPMHMQELEQSYLADLIGRIGGEESCDFFGPMAARIKKLIEEKAEFIGSDEAEAKEKVIKDQLENLLHISGHPWGLCVLMKTTETQAKCYDQKSKIPQFDEASSFETCSGCTHRVSHRSQLEDIKRFVLAHEEFVRNFPIQSTIMKKVSTEAASRGRSIIKEIEGGR